MNSKMLISFVAIIPAIIGQSTCEAAELLVCNFSLTNPNVYRYDWEVGVLSGVFVQDTGCGPPFSMAWGPDNNLYVCHNRKDIIRYDGKSGAFMDIFVPWGASTSGTPSSITFGPDGNLYVLYNSWVGRFDGNTGDLIGVFFDGTEQVLNGNDIEFGPDGNLYVSNACGNILRYDGHTGDFVDVVAEVIVPNGLAFGPDGKLYTTEGSWDVIAADRSWGVDGGDLYRPQDIAFSPDGNLYVTTLGKNDSGILCYDGESGEWTGTLLPCPGNNPWDLVFTPEPSTLLLIGLGVPMLSGLRRKR